MNKNYFIDRYYNNLEIVQNLMKNQTKLKILKHFTNICMISDLL